MDRQNNVESSCERQTKRLLVCGHFGSGDLGTEVHLSGVLSLLRNSDPRLTYEMTVTSVNPAETEQRYGVHSVRYDHSSVFEVLPDHDAVVIAGAQLQETHDGSGIAVMDDYLQLLYLSARENKPTMLLAAEVGDLSLNRSKHVLNEVLPLAHSICLRDDASRERIEGAGLKQPVQVTVDPTFFLDPPTDVKRQRTVGISSFGYYGQMSGEPEKDEPRQEALAKLADWFIREKGYKVCFLNAQLGLDDPDTEEIIGRMEERASVVSVGDDGSLTSEMRQIAGCDLIVGMRQHVLALAALSGTPFVAISHLPRVTVAIEHLGMADFHLSLDDVNERSLRAKSESALKQREVLSARLQDKVGEFNKEAEHLASVVGDMCIENVQVRTPDMQAFSEDTRCLFANTHIRLAKNFSAQGRFANAAQQYELGMLCGFREPSVLNNYAAALARSGDPEKAKEVLRGILKEHPTMPLSRENLRRLEAQTRLHNENNISETSDMPDRKPTLSVCMIVKNEEKDLPECLQLIVGRVDEIVVVDTGSEDNTVAIAESFGAKVFHYEWNDDFAAARNCSIDHATGDWILWLDADDRIYSEDIVKVREMINGPQNRVFFFKLRNEALKAGKESQMLQIRVFPNVPKMRFAGRIHESVHPAAKELGFVHVTTDTSVTHVGYAIGAEGMDKKLMRNMKMLEEEVKANPTDFRLHFYIAGTASALGDDDRCREVCNKMINHKDCKGWMRAMGLAMLSDLDVRKGDFKIAVSRLRKACKIMPGHPQLILQLAQSYYWMGERDKARDLLGEVITQTFEVSEMPVIGEANRAMAHFFLGRCEEDDENLKAALSQYEKCLEFDGEFAECLVRISGVLMELGRWEAAERACRKAVVLIPDCEVAHSNLGSAHLGQGRLDEAIVCYRQALELEPKYTDAALNLAGVLSQKKEFDEAESIYRSVIDREPDCAPAYHNLGCICSEKGQYEEAVEFHRKALNLGMMDMTVHFALGTALGQLGQNQESEEEKKIAGLYAIASEAPDSAEAWGKLAEALHCSGYYVEALQSYERYLGRDPYSAWGFRRIGDCYRDLGFEEAAQAAYQQADTLETHGRHATVSPEGVLAK